MRDFFKTTLATLLGLLIFCGLGVGGLLLLVIGLSSQSETKVKDKSILVFDLSLEIKDTESSLGTRQLVRQSILNSNAPSSPAIALRTVLDALDAATRDPNIVGLYLRGATTTPATGFANLEEVRGALKRFRATGKPILAYDIDWGEKEYYLGAIANQVVINPLGTVEINGFSSPTLFLTGALQKYGVGIQVTRVGKYKSAVEPFVLTKSSLESRQQSQALLGDVWNQFLTNVGESRKLSVKQLQAIADNQATLIANEALKQRLVDRVASGEQVARELKQLTNSDDADGSFRQVSLKNYAKIAQDTQETKPQKNEVAIIYAEGEIVNGQGGVGEVGAAPFAKQLRSLRQDDNVKAVVLRINSPGGSVTASEIIEQEVLLTRKVKPLIVSMGNAAASGGYWIATHADQIFAEPNTITGSIGVFGLLPNFQKLAASQGITWDTVKTGRYADMETVSRPKTKQELAITQKVVDWIYDQFLHKVATSRKIPKSKMAEIAQGRVWSGAQAKKLRLVDELGGLESAIQAAAKRAKLGSDWKVKEYPDNRDFREQILGQLLSSQVSTAVPPVDPLTAELQKLQQDLAILKSLDDPKGIYARLPFNLRIEP
ncbi:MAG: signal peptide peptidase SppA [Leptolyngbyaceae bacterium]|nr:signal peptide peptidase SppA [Leptolyngbyaceae bacterium]